MISLFFVGIVLATLLFIMLNSKYEITYFGFKRIVSTWVFCFFASVVTLMIIDKLLHQILGLVCVTMELILKIILVGICIYGLYYICSKFISKKLR